MVFKESKLLSTKNVKYFFGTFAGGSVILAGFLSMGWFAPTSIKLDKDYDITQSQIKRLPQYTSFCSLVGIVCVGLISERFGHKMAMLTVNLPHIAALVLMIFVNDVWALYIGRTLASFPVGGVYGVVPTYVCEIAPPYMRGVLISMSYLMGQFALLTEYCIVPIITIKQNFIFTLIVALLSIFLVLLVPESPYWLVKKGKISSAEASLKYFNRESIDVSSDLKIIQEAIEEEKRNKGSYLDLIRIRTNFNSLLIVLYVFLMQMATGGPLLSTFSQIIFERTNFISAELSGIIYCLTIVIFGVLFSPLADSFGRKPLIVISSVLMGFPLAILGLFFHFKEVSADNIFTKLEWIPLVCLITYNVFNSIGVLTIPFSYQTELFPTSVRTQASAVISFYSAVLGISLQFGFTFFTDSFEFSVIFFTLGGICFALAFIAVFILPETKGLSLEEIQKMLNN